MLWVGCPVWASDVWSGSFFPPRTPKSARLAEYARRLNAVEANTTFYGLPSVETVARWHEQTPSGFAFCPKFPQTISHRKRLRDCRAETREFISWLDGLQDRLGACFLQLPPNFSPASWPDLEAYLSALPVGRHRWAVEVRHPAWFGGEWAVRLDDLLHRLGMARVTLDSIPLYGTSNRSGEEHKPQLPLYPEVTASFAFVRYIGGRDDALNHSLLGPWSERVSGWLAAGMDAYFFAHTPDERGSPELARDLYRAIAAHIPLPPLPWDHPDSPREQQLGLL